MSETLSNDEFTGAEGAPEGSAPYPWIINPAIDYLFVTGGAVWIMLLTNYLMIGTTMPFNKAEPRQFILISILYVAQHVFFHAHNVATYFRLWGSEEDKESFRFYRTWLLYAAIGILALVLIVRELIGVLVFFYLVVVFWHYAMQSFGIAMIYCAKRNYILTARETDIFRVLMLVFSAYVTVRFFVTKDVAPYSFYGAAQPFWMPMEEQAGFVVLQICTLALAVVSLSFAVIVGRKLVEDKQFLPAPVVMLLATIVALGCTSQSVNVLLWMYVPALYHASQYLAVSLSYNLKERGLPEGMNSRQIAQEVWKMPTLDYLGKAILVGSSLYVILPHVLSLVNVASFDEAVTSIFVVINCHHFATDAAIWRLRDARIRKLLVE